MSAHDAAPLRWPAEAIWSAVSPALPGFSVEVLPEVDSTNAELMRRARRGVLDPVLLVAEHQSAGRGRLGRDWVSARGDGLMFSLGLCVQPVDWSGLSLAVGLSLVQSLDPHQALGLGLKWPNDIWVGGAHTPRKLAGILIETASTAGQDASTRYVVVGVGINIATPAAHGLSTPPVGLRELHAQAQAPEVLARVVPSLVRSVQGFAQTGFAPLQSAYHARDVLRGQAVRLSDGREGVAQGVDAQGVLQVRSDAGLWGVSSAEVSVRLHHRGQEP